MDLFIKATGCILIAIILCLILSKQGKEFSLLLSIVICCVIAATAMRYLEPIIDFFKRLQSVGQLDSSLLQITLRAVGIGILAEITGLICTDAGNAALGKVLQILACAVVLWLSVPLFSSLLELVEEIMSSV